MQIQALHLAATDVAAQRKFYTTTLGLPLLEDNANSFSVQAGTTRLTFGQTEEQTNFLYHLAFTTPRNKWQEGKDWITQRVPLLEREGVSEFDGSWNSISLYFPDSTGNILEFITHRELAIETPGPFGPADILHISEIGFTVDNVPEHVAKIKSDLGYEIYRGSYADTFAAVGDIYGLFIIVRKGRAWWPTNDVQAVVSPVEVTVAGEHQHHLQLDQYPYHINITK